MAKKSKGAFGGEYMFEPAVRRGTLQEGTSGNDDITGDSDGNYNIIRGNSGDDTLQGSGWNSLIEGGTGNDLLQSYEAGDFMYGGEGDDTLIAGGGTDQIDVMKGENGNDTLINKDAYALMIGGQGRDTFVIGPDALGTTINDFNSRDGDLIKIEGIDPALARQLVSGSTKEALQAITERYNIRLEKVKDTDVQVQAVTGDSGSVSIEIRGK